MRLRRKWPSSIATAILSTALTLAIPSVSVSQAEISEYEVKAAYLFNFAKFVEWPPQALARDSTTFNICLLGDPFEGALEKIVEGEVLDGRRLAVRHVRGGEDLQGCQILYVPASEARAPRLFAGLSRQPVLTVGETDNFLSNGGIVRFVQVAGRIRFQINPGAAERASLKLSSKLLRLAMIVRVAEPPGAMR